MIRLRARKPFLSMVVLAWAYLAAGLFLYLGLAWLTHQRLGGLQEEVAARADAQAQSELAAAVEELVGYARTGVRELATWNEVLQQLHDSSFYARWRSDRLIAGERVPEAVIAAELYDHEGRALAPNPPPPLPPRLPAGGEDMRVFEQDGYVYLLAVAPVHARGAQTRQMGFVATAYDFLATLGTRGRFYQLEPAGLRLPLPPGAELSPGAAAARVQYGPSPDPLGARFAGLLDDYIYRVLAAALVLTLALYASLWFLLVVPLRRLTAYIERLRHGDLAGDGNEVGPLAMVELDKVRRSINEYQSTLEVVHSGLSRKNRRLWKLAHHDPLTGCLNRRAFEEDWSHLVSMTEGRTGSVSLMLVDCDHFKAVNDSYGHQVGDRVLRTLAVALQRGLRPGDRVYRLGSDEFAVMFSGCTAEEVQQLAQQCQEAVRRLDLQSMGVKESLRISVGLAHASGQERQRLHELYRHANIALYNAKLPRGNKISTYYEALESSTRALLSTRAARALDETLASGKNLRMYYQPVVATEDGQTGYYEALVRIVDEDIFIPPDHFLPLLESRNLSVEFDELVLAAVLADLESGAIPGGTGVAVNLSGGTVVSADIRARLAAFEPLLSRYKILIEVTETELITQLQVAADVLGDLRRRGFLVALDDFGSGYSSLRYLADMPVDVVKFDIALVQTLCDASPQSDLLARLVGLVKIPGYRLVAEGIENAHMHDTMIRLGFDYLQGYYLGEPKLPRELGPVSARVDALP